VPTDKASLVLSIRLAKLVVFDKYEKGSGRLEEEVALLECWQSFDSSEMALPSLKGLRG
jgi:hypothetical protein